MALISEESNHVEKLIDETSYQIWKFQISVTFKALDIFEIVNGDKLYSNLTRDEDKTEWNKRDAKAQKLIVTTIDKKLIMHIMDCKNSKEMFDKLKNIFEKSTSDQKCMLLQQFYSFSYKKGSDMSLHISQIENIVHKLKSLNQTIDDNMLISKILSTLPENYSHFVTAWESASSSEKTLEKLTARLLTEEARNKSKEKENEIAFESTERFCKKCKSKTHSTRFCKKGKEERKCFKCGISGHIARNCPGEGTSSGASTTNKRFKECNICKKTNHAEQDCFFKKKKQGENKIAFLSENSNLCTRTLLLTLVVHLT